MGKREQTGSGDATQNNKIKYKHKLTKSNTNILNKTNILIRKLNKAK